MIKYHHDLEQQSDEWRAARCGLLTASEMKLVITPTLKIAANDKSRSHVWELAAQRINEFVEPTFESFDMRRGKEEEGDAVILYHDNYAPLTNCGFVTNDELGFKIGFSPDALCGEDGFVEVKSRCQKYQVETICNFLPIGKIPDEFTIQVQTGLFVTGRKWCDFISFGNGMPMAVIRVEPDCEVQRAIKEAAVAVEKDIQAKIALYEKTIGAHKLIKTVRKNRSEEITT